MQEKEYRISATLDQESNDKLEAVAKKQDRTISNMLRIMIKEFKA